MEPNLTARGCHLPYGITVCHPKQVNTPPYPQPNRLALHLPTSGKAELIKVTGYIPRWFTCPQTVTHPSTSPAVHDRESNLQLVDHESDALTTLPLSHPMHVKFKKKIRGHSSHTPTLERAHFPQTSLPQHPGTSRLLLLKTDANRETFSSVDT